MTEQRKPTPLTTEQIAQVLRVGFDESDPSLVRCPVAASDDSRYSLHYESGGDSDGPSAPWGLFKPGHAASAGCSIDGSGFVCFDCGAVGNFVDYVAIRKTGRRHALEFIERKLQQAAQKGAA